MTISENRRIYENTRFFQVFPDFPEELCFNNFKIKDHIFLALHAYLNHGDWYSYFLDELPKLGREYMDLYIKFKFNLSLFLKYLYKKGELEVIK